MKFIDFYPAFSDFEASAELTAKETQLDDLFFELAEKEGEVLSPQESKRLCDLCDEALKDNPLSAKDILSSMVHAAVFAVKMELLKRQVDEKSTAAYLQSDDRLLFLTKVLEELFRGKAKTSLVENFIENLKKFYLEIKSQLPKALTLKAGTQPQDLTIVDFLAANSAVSAIYRLQPIRQIYHELWQVAQLRPILELAAYWKLGYKFSDEKERGLAINFVGIKFPTSDGENEINQNSSGLSYKNSIFITLGTNGVTRTKEDIAETIIHELWHQFEKRFYQNNSMPFAKKMAAENKEKFQQMIRELMELNYKRSPLMSQEVNFKLGKIVKNPSYDTFQLLKLYAEERHYAEFPVRVPAVLANLNKMDSDSVLLAMSTYGLAESVKFFGAEIALMQAEVEKMRQKSGIAFKEGAAEFVEVPTQANYQSTPFHDIVRSASNSKNYDKLKREIARKQKYPNEHNSLEVDSFKDSPFQTALRIAIATKNPDLLFCFQPLLQYAFPQSTLCDSLCYLVELMQEMGATGETARQIFRDSLQDAKKRKSYDEFNVFCIVAHSYPLTLLDDNIYTKLRSQDEATIRQLMDEIDEGKIPFIDKTGFSFSDYLYMFSSEMVEKMIKAEFFINENLQSFFKYDKLRNSLIEANFEEFTVEMKERENLKIFDPKKRLMLRNFNDCIIEQIAYNCVKEKKLVPQWVDALIEIAGKYQINLEEKVSEISKASPLEIIKLRFPERAGEAAIAEIRKKIQEPRGNLQKSSGALSASSLSASSRGGPCIIS